MNNLLIVIPSRLNSKRLKNKPLIKIGQFTLIELVYKNIKLLKNYKILVEQIVKKLQIYAKIIKYPL